MKKILIFVLAILLSPALGQTADTYTPYLGLILPEILNPGKDVWGVKLNNNWSDVDAGFQSQGLSISNMSQDISNMSEDISNLLIWDVDTATPLNGVRRLRHSDANFIGNAGLDVWLAGDTSAPSGWILQNTATIAKSIYAVQGTYAAELTFGAADDGELYNLFIANTVVDYTFSCYVNRISGSGTMRMVLQQAFGGYVEDHSHVISATGGWQLAVLTGKPSGNGWYRISFRANDSAGSVWLIDECKVQESKGVATTWTAAAIDDSFEQNVWGTKYWKANQEMQAGLTLGMAQEIRLRYNSATSEAEIEATEDADRTLSLFNNNAGRSLHLTLDGSVTVGTNLLVLGTASFASMELGSLSVGGTTPALSSCGTGTPTITGGDMAGIITMKEATNTCTVDFAVPYTNAPACVVVSSRNTYTVGAATTTDTLVLSTSGNVTIDDKLTYNCMGL